MVRFVVLDERAEEPRSWCGVGYRSCPVLGCAGLGAGPSGEELVTGRRGTSSCWAASPWADVTGEYAGRMAKALLAEAAGGTAGAGRSTFAAGALAVRRTCCVVDHGHLLSQQMLESLTEACGRALAGREVWT